MNQLIKVMKRFLLLVLLSLLPVYVYAQQETINRNIAGLTLGRRYTVAQAERAIEKKNHTFTKVYRESSSKTIMSLGSVQFAGEGWNHMIVVVEFPYIKCLELQMN